LRNHPPQKPRRSEIRTWAAWGSGWTASGPSEIETLLKQLHVEVGRIAKELPPEKAEEAAADLETLTQEATKEKPRRRWWELSAEGIIDAAKSVGQVGVTAIALIEKLLPLLGA